MEFCKQAILFFLSLLLFVGFLFINHQLVINDNNEASSLYEDQSGAINNILSSSSPWTITDWLQWLPLTPTKNNNNNNNNGHNKLNDLQPKPLTVNLSSCHPSYSKGHRLVHCCPATDDAAQPVIDFQFPDPTHPKRVRRPAHHMNSTYIANYEKAIGIMKNLNKDHPHNFWRQANVHCLYCTGGYMQSNTSLLFNIHRSWLFFPWHRAMIYFHERIVRKLIGDDDFALPYWQWDAPEGMTIPEMYFNGYLVDKWRDETHFPPRIADHSFVKGESGLDSEGQIEYNLAFMYTQMVSGARKTELFMGCRLSAGEQGYCNGPGTIEAAPHNTLHTWVGSGFNPERENMGSFYSAARDPVFYAHHANIDRMWSVWKKMNGDKLEFSDRAWLDTEFYFFDENVQLVRLKVSDMLDIDKLGYEYEDAQLPWLDYRPKPAVNPKVAKKMLEDSKLLCGNEVSGPWRLDRTIRARVQRPRRRRIGDDEDEEIVVVYGIDSKGERTKFDVFVNLVDESKASCAVREFAGTFVSLSHGSNANDNGDAKAMDMRGHLKLGISEILHDLEAEEDDSILVTLVPRIESNVGMSTTVEGIRIEYMEE